MATEAPISRRLAVDVLRRHFFADVLTWSGRLLACAGALVTAFVLCAKRFFPVLTEYAGIDVFSVTVTTAAVLAGTIIAVRRLPRLADASLLIDERLGFKDAISTALFMPESADSQAKAIVISRAESLAAKHDAAQVVKLNVNPSWYAALAMFMIAMLGVRFLPTVPASATRESMFERIDAELARKTIAQASEDLGQGSEALDTTARTELAEIERELLGERAEAGEALRDAADALDQAANRREAEAANDRREDDALRRALQAARESGKPTTSELAGAIEETDFERAAKEANQLADQAETLTEQDRKDLAQELDQLAESLEKIDESTPTSDNERTEQSEDSKQGSKTAPSSIREMSKALKDAAERMKEPAQSPEQRTSEPARESKNEQSSEKAQDQQSAKSAEEQQQDPKSGDASPRQSQAQTSPDREASQQREEQGSESSNTQQARENSESSRSQSGTSQQQREARQSGEQGDDTGQERQSEQSGQTQSRQSGDSKDAMRRLAEKLKEAAQRGEKSDRSSQSAEQLRERADEMRGESAPGQQRELRELRERIADGPSTTREGGESPGDREAKGPRQAPSNPENFSPERFESVDARPNEVDPNVRRRMLSEIDGSGDSGSAEGGAWRRSVEEAAKGAERAIERKSVPRERREFVRRVFQRYVERARGESTPAEPRRAEDVPAGGGP